MTINYHGTSDFTAEARHLITGVENSKPSVHDDGVHVPTIGYGYAMVIKKNGRWGVKWNGGRVLHCALPTLQSVRRCDVTVMSKRL